ncbi:hypothetical protein ACRWQL_11165 [Shewanella sp. HL-SH4]|uniref:hypothetical protein n=1 Tax=Shewanella sp. HL-SH4 TaxID=3436240 RepID=UPI003EC0C6EC
MRVSITHAEPFYVDAIEYPPYLIQQQTDKGEAFAKLSQAMTSSGFEVMANFLSSARVHKKLVNQDWCASFIPPFKTKKNHKLVPLYDDILELKLHRLVQSSQFTGDKIEGMRIAQLRMMQPKGVIKQFSDAGAVLFDIESIQQGTHLLIKNRVDYVYADLRAITFAANQLGIPIEQIQSSTTVFRKFPIGVWINTQCPISQKVLNHLGSKGFKAI